MIVSISYSQEPDAFHTLTIGIARRRISTKVIERPAFVRDLNCTIVTCERAQKGVENTDRILANPASFM